MMHILADTNLGQAIQGSITECTEFHTDRSAGRVIKPGQEIGECPDHTHHINGHEFLDGIDVLDKRFDDGDELRHKTKRWPYERAEVNRTCSRKFEKFSDQSRSGAAPVLVISWITLWPKEKVIMPSPHRKQSGNSLIKQLEHPIIQLRA